MKRLFKISISVLLVIIMITGLFTSFSITGFAVLIQSGDCGASGNNAVYSLYDDNILVISGEGEMADYTSDPMNSTAPWKLFYDYTNYGFMQKIVIANGITSVGNYAFRMNETNNYKVNLINLPDSLLKIGEHAFCNEKNISSITIPQNVRTIENCAFDGCTNLKTVNLYANPDNLEWALAESGLSADCKIHVMSDKITAYQTKYSAYSDRFVGDLVEPTNVVPNGKHILVSYEDPSPSILAGALPYSIKSVRTDNNSVWPITYGSRGFVTCIKDGSDYYALTDNNSGILKKLEINETSGKALHISENAIYNDVTLRISHEYIGANSIKMIYTVKNNTNADKTFKLGTSGDIKIGSDDRATITPLIGSNNETASEETTPTAPLESSNNEIGITMTSSVNSDKVDGKSPTLGFAAKGIAGSESATYFYGAVNANSTAAATAVKSDIFIPERIFTTNTNSQTTGNLSGVDSGLSFYWDVALSAKAEKQYAVIFSVPNTESNKENETVINELEGNINNNNDKTYTITNPPRTIIFDNEVVPQNDDVLAQSNHYDTLKNFVILGVQKKPEITHRNCMRFVTVVNTNILKDADEYGYIIAKKSRSNSNTYLDIRSKIGQITYYSDNIYKENIKETSNKISGAYGDYNSETPYKYVTLGLNDIPSEVVFIVRFYVKKGNRIQYADYYDDSSAKHDGCSADWDAIAALH